MKTAIIGRAAGPFSRAKDAICHNRTVCSAMAIVIDQPNPRKKSR